MYSARVQLDEYSWMYHLFTFSSQLNFTTATMMLTAMPTFRLAAPLRAAAPARRVLAKAGGEDYAKTLNGITAPTGFFDPLSLSANTSPEQVKRYREAELTHGRVCMLAAIGFLVGEAVQDKTLFYNWDGNITGPAIVHFQQTRQGFWEPLVIFIGVCEAYRVAVAWANPAEDGAFVLKDNYSPGQLGFDPLGICPTDEAEFNQLQTKEINNGRLAMIATAGFVAQELVNKKGIIENLQAST